MKKITFLSLMLIFMISSSVQAHKWAYAFVVWDGKVYEVKEEQIIEESEIGESIGEVNRQPNPNTYRYYGNASNFYPVGTPYYEIKGISTSTAIAVKVDNRWLKADYVHNAPFHIMNILTKLWEIVPFVIVPLILIAFIYRVKKIRSRK